MPRRLVGLKVYVPFVMTDQGQYTTKTSRPRNGDRVPVDRLSLELCWWAVRELVYGRKKQVYENAFVMESTDSNHIRLYMAAAIHNLGRGTDRVAEASHVGIDQEMRDHQDRADVTAETTATNYKVLLPPASSSLAAELERTRGPLA
jgi:hypothetical protein